jgi:membrane protein
MLARSLLFVKRGIWRIQAKDLPRGKSFLLNLLRIIILTFRGMAEDKIQLRASALTFFSLLSIVPVGAMAFAFAKGFGFQAALEREVLKRFQGQEEVAARIIDFAHNFLGNVRGGMMAGVGFIVLLWAILNVLGNLEKAFNDIWGVKKGRPIGRKITDYLALSLIYPILLVSSSAMTVVATSQVSAFVHSVPRLAALGPIIFFLLKLVPYGIIWALLGYLYIFMPNTKVHVRSGIWAGLIAGIFYQVFQFAYIKFQIGVASYNAIYGSFAALPLFLIWLLVSWLIVLTGAEIAFAYQNVGTYEFEPDCLEVSSSFKRLVALAVVHLVVKQFAEGEEPLGEEEISHRLEIPIRLARQILYELAGAKILSPVNQYGENDVAYQPAIPPASLTIKGVLDALDHRGTDDIPVARSEVMEKISECLRGFGEAVKKSPQNMALVDI